jgi:hypothetical protein
VLKLIHAASIAVSQKLSSPLGTAGQRDYGSWLRLMFGGRGTNTKQIEMVSAIRVFVI